MTIAQLQKHLLTTAGKRVAEFGFDPNPKGQSFVRRFPDGNGWNSLHLSFIKHPADFDVTADVSVRLDELEDFIMQPVGQSKKESGGASLGAELGNIHGTGQLRWTVASEPDVESVSARVIEAFARVGLPYLQRASTFQGAYDLLTLPGRDSWISSPIHSQRALRIVALAKLLGKSSREINDLVEKYRTFLRQTNDFGLQDFEALASQMPRK